MNGNWPSGQDERDLGDDKNELEHLKLCSQGVLSGNERPRLNVTFTFMVPADWTSFLTCTFQLF